MVQDLQIIAKGFNCEEGFPIIETMFVTEVFLMEKGESYEFNKRWQSILR